MTEGKCEGETGLGSCYWPNTGEAKWQGTSVYDKACVTIQKPAKIIVTPIGGQGFIFGRGNQQISPNVIRKVGRRNILIVSPSEKLNALQGEPLLVDTGEPEVDQMLSGYLPVIVGYHDKVIYRVAC